MTNIPVRDARMLIRASLLTLLAGTPWLSLAATQAPVSALSIPQNVTGPKRHITTDDLARLRDIDSLSVSPDGTRFAILVRQAVPEQNTYRTAWFVGALRGGALTHVGDGGEARLLTRPNGRRTGDFGGSVSRWSPDGQHIAYMMLRDGEVQLWMSRVDGSHQQQLTHNASDVRDFAWSSDGRRLLFTVGSTRIALAEHAEARDRSGYRLQEFDAMARAIQSKPPSLPLETQLIAWSVAVSGDDARVADEAEQAELAAAQKRQFGLLNGGVEVDVRRMSAALGPPIQRGDGAAAWLERVDPSQDGPLPVARLNVLLSETAKPIACTSPLCEGQVFRKIWWSKSGDEVLFWRVDGATEMSYSLYSWSPSKNVVRTLVSSDAQMLDACELTQRHIVCLREAPLEPKHIATIDLKTGAVRRVADVNPEMALFRLGRIERIEWDTGPRAAQLQYASRARGFVLYPPDYDPRKKYPVFIAPYSAGGFLRGDVGDEHPLLVYAANGVIVVNSAFPGLTRTLVTQDSATRMRRLYDPALGYPHMSIYAESAFAGLDAAMTRANIDPARTGAGGVSHGTLVPLFMMQKEKRLAALSVAGGSWSSTEYYIGPLPEPYGERAQTMWPEDPSFWAPLDLSQHLGEIEAPVLFQIADAEVVTAAVLLRRMADARLAVDAYSFPNELHLKWQSAHRLAVYNRNLDWFRFWLQDVEDPNATKTAQYEHWRKLRALQCANQKSLRNYCGVVSVASSPAR